MSLASMPRPRLKISATTRRTDISRTAVLTDGRAALFREQRLAPRRLEFCALHQDRSRQQAILHQNLGLVRLAEDEIIVIGTPRCRDPVF